MPVLGPHNRPTLEHAEWVAEAVRLYTKGWSYRRIGKKLGVHFTTVREAVLKEFARIRLSDDELRSEREAMIARYAENEADLEAVKRAFLPHAKTGSPDAADVVINATKAIDKVRVSVANLLGLQAPKRTELTGKDGAPLVEADPNDDILGKLARIAAGAAEGGGDPGSEPG